MDSTEARIVSAARAAQQIGEPCVTIEVAGLPVTVHATNSAPENDSSLTRGQVEILPNRTAFLTTCKN